MVNHVLIISNDLDADSLNFKYCSPLQHQVKLPEYPCSVEFFEKYFTHANTIFEFIAGKTQNSMAEC